MNQHNSPKADVRHYLDLARRYLRAGMIGYARAMLTKARRLIDAAPASTRRRWKAGK